MYNSIDKLYEQGSEFMESLLTNLWYGSDAPFESCGKNDPEIIYLAELMERNKEALCALCSPQQLELFQKYTDCTNEYLIRHMELAFIKGFSLSSGLMTEALSHIT